MSQNSVRARSTTEIAGLLQEQLAMYMELERLALPLREFILKNYREGIEPGKWTIAESIPDYRPLVVAAQPLETINNQIAEFGIAIRKEITAAVESKDFSRLERSSTYQEMRDKIQQSHIVEARRLVRLLETKVTGAWRAKRDRAYRTHDWSELSTLFSEFLSIQETRLRLGCALGMFRLGFHKRADSMCKDAISYLSKAVMPTPKN